MYPAAFSFGNCVLKKTHQIIRLPRGERARSRDFKFENCHSGNLMNFPKKDQATHARLPLLGTQFMIARGSPERSEGGLRAIMNWVPPPTLEIE